MIGAFKVMLEFRLADPIIGPLISAAIIVLLWGTVRSFGHRLMDDIDEVQGPRWLIALGFAHADVGVRPVDS